MADSARKRKQSRDPYGDGDDDEADRADDDGGLRRMSDGGQRDSGAMCADDGDDNDAPRRGGGRCTLYLAVAFALVLGGALGTIVAANAAFSRGSGGGDAEQQQQQQQQQQFTVANHAHPITRQQRRQWHASKRVALSCRSAGNAHLLAEFGGGEKVVVRCPPGCAADPWVTRHAAASPGGHLPLVGSRGGYHDGSFVCLALLHATGADGGEAEVLVRELPGAAMSGGPGLGLPPGSPLLPALPFAAVLAHGLQSAACDAGHRRSFTLRATRSAEEVRAADAEEKAADEAAARGVPPLVLVRHLRLMLSMVRAPRKLAISRFLDHASTMEEDDAATSALSPSMRKLLRGMPSNERNTHDHKSLDTDGDGELSWAEFATPSTLARFPSIEQWAHGPPRSLGAAPQRPGRAGGSSAPSAVGVGRSAAAAARGGNEPAEDEAEEKAADEEEEKQDAAAAAAAAAAGETEADNAATARANNSRRSIVEWVAPWELVLFHRADFDGSGGLSLGEYGTAADAFERTLCGVVVWADANGDQRISVRELANLDYAHVLTLLQFPLAVMPGCGAASAEAGFEHAWALGLLGNAIAAESYHVEHLLTKNLAANFTEDLARIEREWDAKELDEHAVDAALDPLFRLLPEMRTRALEQEKRLHPAAASDQAASPPSARDKHFEQLALPRAAAAGQGEGGAGAAAADAQRWAVCGGAHAYVSAARGPTQHHKTLGGCDTYDPSGAGGAGDRVHLDRDGWCTAASAPLPSSGGSASWKTAGPRNFLFLGLVDGGVWSEAELSRGGNLWDDPGGSWLIHCDRGELHGNGIEMPGTGRIEAGQLVRVDWDAKGVRFFVDGERRGETLTWGALGQPKRVRLAANMDARGQTATFV